MEHRSDHLHFVVRLSALLRRNCTGGWKKKCSVFILSSHMFFQLFEQIMSADYGEKFVVVVVVVVFV